MTNLQATLLVFIPYIIIVVIVGLIVNHRKPKPSAEAEWFQRMAKKNEKEQRKEKYREIIRKINRHYFELLVYGQTIIKIEKHEGKK